HHQLTVFGDGRPGGHGAERRVHGADDVRDDHRGRTGTVIGDLAHEAAEAVEEAIELALRVVEHARAGPARTGIDRFIAVGALDPAEFRGDEVERLVPRHSDKWLDAAPRTVTPHAVLQPALAYHRPFDPARGVHRARHGGDDAAGLGIFGKGSDAYDPTSVD